MQDLIDGTVAHRLAVPASVSVDTPRVRLGALAFALARWRWVWPLVFVAAGAVAFAIDVPVAYAVVKAKAFYWMRRPLQSAEPFGEVAGVLLILVSIYLLDPCRRLKLPRILAAALAAGLVADFAKLFVSRVRPYKLNFKLGTPDCWDTFTGWLPMGIGRSYSQSFPSAHTATAVAFAIVLAALYPRGRWFFPSVAFLVALQRVETGAHYVSDVLFGAAIGVCCGLVFVSGTRVSEWFERTERKLPISPNR